MFNKMKNVSKSLNENSYIIRFFSYTWGLSNLNVNKTLLIRLFMHLNLKSIKNYGSTYCCLVRFF